MNKILEDIKRAFESKTAFRALSVIGIIVVLLIVFRAGVTVGFHKASFGRAWGENYERNFGMMPNRPMFVMFGRDNFPNANGAIGKIIKIETPTIIVQDKDGTEKVILVKSDTQVEKMRETIGVADLKIDDFVVVIGSPNPEGQIEAKLIRLMPSPEFLIK